MGYTESKSRREIWSAEYEEMLLKNSTAKKLMYLAEKLVVKMTLLLLVAKGEMFWRSRNFLGIYMSYVSL